MPSTEVKRRLAEDVALWQADGIIDDDTRTKLQARYDTPGFGLVTAVKYLGIAGGMLAAFGLLGFIAAIADSEAFATLILVGIAGFVTWGGLKLGRDPLARYEHSAQIVVALGLVAWAGAVGVGSHALGIREARLPLVVGGGVLPLAFLVAYRERNSFLLIIGLLGLFHWVGSWTTMWGRSSYVFALEEPRLMAPFALAVFGAGVWHERQPRPRFWRAYQATALVYFNLSLLILSIEGRSTLGWVLVFTVAALAQIVAGARMKSALVTGFGVTALGIDLFTRYFERMWDRVDQGTFFLVGGVLLMGFGAAVERALRKVRA